MPPSPTIRAARLATRQMGQVSHVGWVGLLSLASLVGLSGLMACSTTVTPDPAGQASTPGTSGLSGTSAPVSQTAQAKATTPGASPAPTTVERKSYGSPIDATVEKVELSELLKNSAKYADRTVRTEGTVSAVCQGKGCWLELADERGQAHVKLGNHKFFVPRSSAGKRAIVEAKVLPAVDDGHCEQEAVEQTGQVARIELDAIGVELF